jgi:hypothetical protein
LKDSLSNEKKEIFAKKSKKNEIEGDLGRHR